MLASGMLVAGQHRISSLSVISSAEDGLLEGCTQRAVSARAVVDGSDQTCGPIRIQPTSDRSAAHASLRGRRR
jgi:hypothetical protein